MRKRSLPWLVLALSFLIPLAFSLAHGQTVRLQDANSPNTAAVTAQGAVFVTTSAGAGSAAIYCSGTAAISQGANTRVIVGTTGTRTRICTVLLISAAAQSVSVVEGTGATCGTNTVALIGATTASIALAQNGGFSSTAPSPWLQSAGLGTDICVFQSAGSNVSGVITFRQE